MAMIPDFFTTRYLGKLSDFVEGEIFNVLGVKGEVKKFKKRWESIRGFLHDAEHKRHGNEGINTWLRELKDIMYEADDIFDLCMFDGGRLLSVDPSASSMAWFPINLVSSYFQCIRYRREIANRIGGLNDRLKQIADDSVITTQLVQCTEKGPQEHRNIRSDETSPIQVKEDIVGTQIEDDAEKLVKLILPHDKRKCVMFGIVGMGGIGKTTLACKLFNDQRIEENFSKCVWLSVSKNYSETGLLREVVRGAGGNDAGAQSKAELETKIASLQLTTLFLVLDNVWSSDVWMDLLRRPILCGVASCKILVTTRDETVARSMRASHDKIHLVSKMDEDSGWKLLRNIVFGDKEENMIPDPELEQVGSEIVKKCAGLPLAIKVMAGVLLGKERTRGEWVKVLRSDTWHMKQINDELPRALCLSYEDLPSHLKPCFLSCALYNGIAGCGDLVRLWEAEGFIVEGGGRLMEEVGEDYYKELIFRNLLQLDPRYPSGVIYTMHDLLRSLGASLMEEGITVNDNQRLNTKSSMKIHRLSMSNKKEILRLPNDIEEKCIRVLHLFDSPETKIIECGVLERCGSLRVLNLCSSLISSLPESIGTLIHLRYLGLEGTDISEVPESIGRLANLQTLDIARCKYLHELPKSITRLYNLRCLHLQRTPLTHVPKGIGGLTNLNNLHGFVVGRDDSTSKAGEEGCDLGELESLSNLRHLSIRRLERLLATRASVLASKPLLKFLYLYWTGQGDEHNQGALYSEEQIKRAQKICDQLTPPSSLFDIYMYDFPGQQFPGWLMSTSIGTCFPNLEYLNLKRFPLCTKLPPLGQLPQLKYIRIVGARAIKTIGPEFLGSRAFPKLEYLFFIDMPNWEEWLLSLAEEEEVGDAKKQIKLLPNLWRCALKDCPMLRALPEGLCHATNLKELILENTSNLREIDDLLFLSDKLYVIKNERLGKISNLPSLKYLKIVDCPSLEYVENVGTLQHLDLLCPLTAEHLPQWLPRLIDQHYDTHSVVHLPPKRKKRRGAPSSPRPSLKKFRLTCSLPMLESCLKGNYNWQIIQQIPDVEVHTLDGDAFMMYTEHPHKYETNVGPN